MPRCSKVGCGYPREVDLIRPSANSSVCDICETATANAVGTGSLRVRMQWSATEVAQSQPLSRRLLRILRALIVGSGATLVDFSIFTSCIRLAGVAPTVARLPALCAGASVQFFGNRVYTFRAQAGSLSRQARWFVMVELCTLAFNWLLFRVLATHIRSMPPELLSFVGTFLVFVTFAYPLRRLVIFKVPGKDRS